MIGKEILLHYAALSNELRLLRTQILCAGGRSQQVQILPGSESGVHTKEPGHHHHSRHSMEGWLEDQEMGTRDQNAISTPSTISGSTSRTTDGQRRRMATLGNPLILPPNNPESKKKKKKKKQCGPPLVSIRQSYGYRISHVYFRCSSM